MSAQGEFRLDGKTAVITGAGSGIGRAIALKFAANGATVRMLDLNLNDAEAVTKEIATAGGSASAHSCDVSDQKQVISTFDHLAKQSRIDILVNNAGISQIGNVEATPEDAFDRIIRVNVKGYYNCIYVCIGHMKAQGGVILNIASIAGSVGVADRFGYSTSKGAIIAMTYSVARDYLAHNIRCNCMAAAALGRSVLFSARESFPRPSRRPDLRG